MRVTLTGVTELREKVSVRDAGQAAAGALVPAPPASALSPRPGRPSAESRFVLPRKELP